MWGSWHLSLNWLAWARFIPQWFMWTSFTSHFLLALQEALTVFSSHPLSTGLFLSTLQLSFTGVFYLQSVGTWALYCVVCTDQAYSALISTLWRLFTEWKAKTMHNGSLGLSKYCSTLKFPHQQPLFVESCFLGKKCPISIEDCHIYNFPLLHVYITASWTHVVGLGL